jgi:hypothetical protein
MDRVPAWSPKGALIVVQIVQLFIEHLFNVTDFLLELPAHFLRCAFIPHVGVADGLSDRFFHSAFELVSSSVHFVFSRVVHAFLQAGIEPECV